MSCQFPVIVNTATVRDPRFAPDLPDRLRIDPVVVAGATVAPPCGPLPVLVAEPVDAAVWPEEPPLDAVAPEPAVDGDVLEEPVLDGEDDPAVTGEDEAVPVEDAEVVPPVADGVDAAPVAGVDAVVGCPGPGPRAVAT